MTKTISAIPITILLLGVFSEANAQSGTSTDPYVVSVDFEKKIISHTALNKVKQGDFVQVKVTNLNQNLYKVSLNKKDTTFYSSVQMPSFSTIDIIGVSDLLTKLLPFSTNVTTPPDIKILSIIMGDNKINTKIYTGRSFETELNSILISLISTKENLLKAKYDFDDLNLEIKKYVLNRRNINPKNIGTFNSSQNNIPEIVTNIEASRKNLQTINLEITAVQLELNNVMSDRSFEAWRKKEDANQAFVQDINTLIKSLDTIAAKAYSAIDATRSTEILENLLNLENNKADTFVSLPMMINGDLTSLDISIIPKDTSTKLPGFYTSDFKFPARPNLYLGTGVSFFYSSLKSEAYSTVETRIDSTKSSYQLNEEKGLRGEIGIMALLHYGSKIAKTDWGFNGVIGPALSLGNVVKPRLAFGAGISYGSKQMVTANLLLMAGYESRLSTVYNTNTDYDTKPENPVVSKLAMGWGISLGYIYIF